MKSNVINLVLIELVLIGLLECFIILNPRKTQHIVVEIHPRHTILVEIFRILLIESSGSHCSFECKSDRNASTNTNLIQCGLDITNCLICIEGIFPVIMCLGTVMHTVVITANIRGRKIQFLCNLFGAKTITIKIVNLLAKFVSPFVCLSERNWSNGDSSHFS